MTAAPATVRKIDRLIVNNPYVEPTRHWKYDPDTQGWSLVEGRRPAGYVTASGTSGSFDDPGIFRELPLANKIRPRVRKWREAGYPGATGVTRRLLDHWRDPNVRANRFFFCQVEAVETLIWLTEAPESERTGIQVPSDGGDFLRECCKMATGTGKTIVMGLVIAWQVLNKVTNPQDARFSKHVFVVAPGLTVRNRLEVLTHSARGSVYHDFDIIPPGLHDKFTQGKVVVRNWHVLQPLDPNSGPKVIKKGPESDEAFCRRVLDEIGTYRNLLVINDEAHHAWRVPPKPAHGKGDLDYKRSVEEATIWVGGLDRIHKARGILKCFDFTATPFAPTGKASGEETLFPWVVSDFGINDAIESGLVKTPRMVVRDDGVPDVATYRSKLYHIYPHVQKDLNRKAKPTEPVPSLVKNAYMLLAKDWKETRDGWAMQNHPVPPVMITVANRTETAARIYHMFTNGHIDIPGIGDAKGVLHIDSKVLDAAEQKEAPEVDVPDASESDDSEEEGDEGASEPKLTKKQLEELLRQQVDTVGKVGKPGQDIHNVISVGMLSEGWDARTVTHIMGLRAFSSQLLCEQVIGRGLRRVSYEVEEETGLFAPEYVCVFGVPFTFLPHEGGGDEPPMPEKPKVIVEPLVDRNPLEISWPNVLRIERRYKERLTLDMSKVRPFDINMAPIMTVAKLGPLMDGRPSEDSPAYIELKNLAETEFRLQKWIFQAAKEVYDQMRPGWRGSSAYLMAQVVNVVEDFLNSNKINYGQLKLQDVDAEAGGITELRRRIALALNMSEIVNHIFGAINAEGTDELELVFEEHQPVRRTSDMRPWGTRKPTQATTKSHINRCVLDSTWEGSEAFHIDNSKLVKSWAKNDHLGFEIHYIYNGAHHRYTPDFLIELTNGKMLILEVKGQKTDRDEVKWGYMRGWVRAVNEHPGLGTWAFAVSKTPGQVLDILRDHSRENAVEVDVRV